MTYQSPWETDETRAFRKTVRAFIEGEFAPRQARWREQGHADAEVWVKAGSVGMLLPDLPE
ncbi:MAG TPA: acyl-CoA dehydrogenase family protein, partial [Polyangiaceae bacterium]